VLRGRKRIAAIFYASQRAVSIGHCLGTMFGSLPVGWAQALSLILPIHLRSAAVAVITANARPE